MDNIRPISFYMIWDISNDALYYLRKGSASSGNFSGRNFSDINVNFIYTAFLFMNLYYTIFVIYVTTTLQHIYFSMHHNFFLKARHVPGKQNTLADLLSRLQVHKFHQLAPTADQLPTPIEEDPLNICERLFSDYLP